MRMSFVNQPSPLLIGVINERTVRDCIAAISNCQYHGATGIDLHLSCLDEDAKNVESIRRIVSATSRPILALNYNHTYERQPFSCDEETRVDLLLKAAEAGVSAVDFQGYTFDIASKTALRPEYANADYSFIKESPREVVLDPVIIDKQMALFDQVHQMGAEVLLSVHPGVPLNCEQVVDLALFLEKRGPDIIKIVTVCKTEEQLVESFKTMIALKKEVKTKTHLHCNGKMGKLSRLINPILGGHLIFCNDGYTTSSAFEQLDLQTAKTALDCIQKIML